MSEACDLYDIHKCEVEPLSLYLGNYWNRVRAFELAMQFLPRANLLAFGWSNRVFSPIGRMLFGEASCPGALRISEVGEIFECAKKDGLLSKKHRKRHRASGGLGE